MQIIEIPRYTPIDFLTNRPRTLIHLTSKTAIRNVLLLQPLLHRVRHFIQPLKFILAYVCLSKYTIMFILTKRKLAC